MPKKMYVPYLIFWSMSGVTCPTMKLFIQSGAKSSLRQSRDMIPRRKKVLTGRSTQCRALCSDTEWPNLSDDDPGAWSLVLLLVVE
jgi:hypothetical protein